MPHIGVKRLGPRYRQHHGPESNEGHQPVMQAEGNAPMRRKRRQHAGIMQHLPKPKKPQHQKPGRTNGAEDRPHLRRAAILHQEKRQQDHHRNRQNGLLQMRGDNLEPLHRRQHGNCRCDDAITKEQTGPGNADQRQGPAQARIFHAALRKGHQRQNTAFPPVIRAQHERDIFHRNSEDQRPDNQTKQTEDFPSLHPAFLKMAGGRAHGVKR